MQRNEKIFVAKENCCNIGTFHPSWAVANVSSYGKIMFVSAKAQHTSILIVAVTMYMMRSLAS